MDFTPTDHAFENEYPKLVRDNIPDIIKTRTGTAPEMRIAENDAEFEGYLLRKFVEESSELQRSGEHGNVEEELADVSELMDALMKLKGLTVDQINGIKQEKRAKNGGFEKRIIMLAKVEKRNQL